MLSRPPSDDIDAVQNGETTWEELASETSPDSDEWFPRFECWLRIEATREDTRRVRGLLADIRERRQ